MSFLLRFNRPLPIRPRQPSTKPQPGITRPRPIVALAWWTLLSVVLTACSAPPVQPHRTAPTTRAASDPEDREAVMAQTSSQRRSVGRYHAERLEGDFADYPSLQQFIEEMVRKHGFERAYLLGLFSQAKRKQWTLDFLAKSDQSMKAPPAQGSWTRYRAKFLTERHINAGVEFARRHGETLQRATRQYGVPGEYILGILAVETTFGGFVGNDRVLDALTTLGFDYQRRGPFFRQELEQYLLMTRQEGLDPARPKGSFAGAMGLGQFMPSSFLKWAVDFNGDGRRDLWDPEDAIGSVANYFAQHGWQAGQPVTTPLSTKGKVDLTPGLERKYFLAELQRAGLRPVGSCQRQEPLWLLRLRHQSYDQYLVGHSNFYTITRYNQSTHYAMAVHELARTIRQRL